MALRVDTVDELPPALRAQALEQLGLAKPQARQGRGTRDSESEKAWTSRVVGIARNAGWWRYHAHDSRRSERGWLDETFIRPPRIVFAELKTSTGKLTREQLHVVGLLKACDAEVFVWRPQDEAEVRRVLAEATQPPRR